ncbi:hypothetical protein DYU05_08900 [Mucilaginibacter terrenus]|uniref:Uncharacterized protein n=1 Tax=Mucilaginibacter terrenus TaxID=2482727 RepID=A0A3E2NXI3_9SPHI|nr:hypothetical protein [Mucilaginibacter terrenus]RFZ85697.1 hypothetical protein DYU05_08900 [Mucilaginibacter terrenus]
MKSIFYITLLSCFLVTACGNQTKKNTRDQVSSETGDVDPRPADQVKFLNKVHDNSAYEVTSNAAIKDAHITAFNKYALDSLKDFKNWEFIVSEINDNTYDANTVSKLLGFNNNPVYNLKLVAPITIDKTVDSIAIDNQVRFTYTTLKTPKGAELKKYLSVIKNLKKDDTVIISGAITHLDEHGKINFSNFFDDNMPWDVDLMLTDIHKKLIKQ